MIADCGSCGDPITDWAWYHHRLRVHLHGDRADCLRNVKGEDVTNHCMSLVELRYHPVEGQET